MASPYEVEDCELQVSPLNSVEALWSSAVEDRLVDPLAFAEVGAMDEESVGSSEADAFESGGAWGGEQAAFERRLQAQLEEAEIRLAAAREEAAEEMRLQCEKETQILCAEERERVLDACVDFKASSERYFRQIEREVVELSLEVAKRILQREVSADALALESAVKGVLASLSDATETVLHVPVDAVAGWRDSSSGRESLGKTAGGPAFLIQGEPTMSVGQCRLETRLGSVDLGVQSQLRSIREDFLEMLNARQ